MSRSSLHRTLSFIQAGTGLVFPEARAADVEAAVENARTRLKLPSVDALYERIQVDERARDDLVGELTIGETYFFRDPGQFELLRRQIIPRLASRPHGPVIRAWSAACATGEEAYSLATVLHECGVASRSSVLGTDISRPRLAAAERGIYRRWSLRGVEDAQVATYFEPYGPDFELKDTYRELVRFSYLNLAEDAYPAISTGVWGMDIILCRNVLIYFDAATVERVASRLVASLSEDGWLLLGASDPAIAEITECEAVVTDAGLIYRRKSRLAKSTPYSALPEAVQPLRVATRQRLAQPTGRAAPPSPRAPARTVVSEPEGADAWIAAIRAHADRGRLDDALRLMNRAVALHAASAELHHLHGVLHAERRQFEAAVDAARRALYVDRDFVLAHILLGNVQRRLGRSGAARRSFLNAQMLLSAMPREALVKAADGETAGRLAEIVAMQLQLLDEVA